MSVAQRGRVFNDCVWEGREGFNTYVLKPSALTTDKTKQFEDRYKLADGKRLTMKVAKFSSQPVRDFMPISKLAKMTPLNEHVPKTVDTSNLRVGNELEIKMSLQYVPFSKLIENFEKLSKEFPDFKLFNEKLIKDGYIKIPRTMIDKLI